jgi:hypothetical protein
MAVSGKVAAFGWLLEPAVPEVARSSGTRWNGPSGSGSGEMGRRTKRQNGGAEGRPSGVLEARLGAVARWTVAGRPCEFPLGGGRRREGGGRSPGSLEGRREADLGSWTGGWKGCWTRRATVGVDGRPFGVSFEALATRDRGVVEAVWMHRGVCLRVSVLAEGRRKLPGLFGKPVKPGPSGCGGAVDRRLDEALARVTDGALRGAVRSACRGGERLSGPTRVPARGGTVGRDEAGVRGRMETDGEQWRRGGNAAEASGGSTS